MFRGHDFTRNLTGLHRDFQINVIGLQVACEIRKGLRGSVDVSRIADCDVDFKMVEHKFRLSLPAASSNKSTNRKTYQDGQYNPPQ